MMELAVDWWTLLVTTLLVVSTCNRACPRVGY